MQRVAVAEYAEINGAKKVNEYTASEKIQQKNEKEFGVTLP